MRTSRLDGRLCLVVVLLCGYVGVACSGASDDRAGTLLVPLEARRESVGSGEAAIGNLLADAILETARVWAPDTDLALIAAGSIRYDRIRARDGRYSPGGIAESDIRGMSWDPDRVSVYRLSGEQLLSLIGVGLEEWPRSSRLFLHASTGVRIHAVESRADSLVVAIGGKPVEEQGQYLVAIPDSLVLQLELFRSRVPAWLAAHECGAGDVSYSLLTYVRSRSAIAPRVEGRIVIEP